MGSIRYAGSMCLAHILSVLAVWWERHDPDQQSSISYTVAMNSMPLTALLLMNHIACRVLCKLSDWRLSSIQMVGTQPLPGIKYTHTFRNGGSKELPVLPSDHFGLLLRLEEV